MQRNNGLRGVGGFLIVLFFLGGLPCSGDPTFQGPSGFIQVPSGKTIKKGMVELAARTRGFKAPVTRSTHYLSNLCLGFSPIRDFEVGVQKAVDTRNGKNDFDPDPTVNFKVRLPPIGSGELAETALGMVLDTNPNNYHSLYFTIGGVGMAWNFGGNPGSGVAAYGGYDKGRKAPKSLALILGADMTPGKAGERGYRSHYYVDYNGDIFSAAWRYQSHRGFWIDAGVHTNGSYDFLYDFLPFSLGLGAAF